MAQAQLKATPEVQALLDAARQANLPGTNDQAGALYDQALAKARELKDRKGETEALRGRGVVYRQTGQPQKALELYNQSLTLYREAGNKRGEADALGYLASAEQKLKKTDQAEIHYAQAVALYEILRDNFGGLSEAKSAFLGSTIKTYYSYLNLLLERGKTTTAFEIAQKTKARSLLDLMASGRVNLTSELSPSERQQEQELRQKADFLNAQMVKEGVENEVGAKTRFAALRDQLKQTESQLQTFTDTLYASHPSLAQKRVAKTATLADIAHLLPADTALLDYIVVRRRQARAVCRHEGHGTSLHSAPYLQELGKQGLRVSRCLCRPA